MIGHGDGVQGVWFCDTEEDFNEKYNELENNPDFSFVGSFDLLNDIDDEFEYQGFTPKQINEMSLARYGNVLDVLEFENVYYAFIGAR